MNLNPEFKFLRELQADDRKQTIPIMGSPKILEMMDAEAKKLRVSRGDLLLACFLRVHASYSGRVTKAEMKATDEAEAVKKYKEEMKKYLV